MINILNFGDDIENKQIYLQAVPNENEIPIVAGKKLSEYHVDDNAIICPNIMRWTESDGNFNVDNTINMKQYLNKELEVNYANKLPYKFKVVGLYDTYSTYSYGGVCYTSYETLEVATNKYYDNNPEEYKKRIDYEIEQKDYYENIYIMVDDVKNVQKVNKFLENNHYFQEGAITEINTESVENIIKICSQITIVLYIIIAIIIVVTLIQNILRKENENFIYYAVGYRKKDIIKIIFVENSIFILIGFILSIGITQLLLNIYKNQVLLTKSRLYLMNPQVDGISIILTMLLILTIPLITTVSMWYIFKQYDYDKRG